MKEVIPILYNAYEVVNHILKRAEEKQLIISNLKLQKILYFIQANFLVTKNKPCFLDPIEAWDFGPVVPKIYNKYKIFGGCGIPWGYYESSDIAEDDIILIDEIIDECQNYDNSTLTKIAQHQTPWTDTNRNSAISLESIKKFFEKK